jgi:hypothetical protein
MTSVIIVIIHMLLLWPNAYSAAYVRETVSLYWPTIPSAGNPM